MKLFLHFLVLSFLSSKLLAEKKFYYKGGNFEEELHFCTSSFEVDRILAEENIKFEDAKDNLRKNLDLLDEATKKQAVKIPHISHHVWFTDPKQPRNLSVLERKFLMKKIKVLNSQGGRWRSILWINTDQGITRTLQIAQSLGIEVKKIETLPSPFHKIIHKLIETDQIGLATDIWRMQVVRDMGGFYSDNDYDLNINIDFLTQTYHSFFGFDDFTERYIGNSIIAASKNHPILVTYYNILMRNLFGTEPVPEYVRYPCNRFSKTIMTSGPTAFLVAVLKSANTGRHKDVVFPHGYIFHLAGSIPESSKTRFEEDSKGQCHTPNVLEKDGTCLPLHEHMVSIGNDQYSGSWIKEGFYMPLLLTEQGLISEQLGTGADPIQEKVLPYSFSEGFDLLKTLNPTHAPENKSCQDYFRQVINTKKKNIAFSAVEYGPYKVGGVSAIVNTLTPLIQKRFQEMKTHQSYFIGPYYSNGIDLNQEAEKVCDLTHTFNKKQTRAEVYKTELTYKIQGENVSIPAFLIDSDEEFPHLFNIKETSSVYGSSETSNTYNRMFYFTSALASLQMLLGASGKPLFDIVHSHSIGAGLSTSLLAKDSLRPISIGQLHNLNFDQGYFEGYTCKNRPYCNLMENLIEDSDQVLAVSESMIKDGLNPDLSLSFYLNEAYSKAARENRITALQNGIMFSAFDPSKNLGPYNFDWQEENIAKAKFRIKKEYLQKAGYISDPNKPLFTFVGRFSLEKGTDMLALAAETIKKLGGSFIVMGVEASYTDEHVQELRRIYQNDPDVYIMRGNYSEEQANAENTGLLVRAASDFMFVPSHEEAFGLVPIEGFAMGALAITSSISGMKDYLVPLNTDTLREGNSFNYNEFKLLKSVLKRERVNHAMVGAIHEAFTYYYETADKDRSELSKRLIQESQKWDWHAPEGSVNKLINLYQKLIEKKAEEKEI